MCAEYMASIALWRQEPSLQSAAQPHARAQKLLRVDGVAIDACLVMQMRARGTARRSDAADDLSDADRLPNLDFDRREMRVAGGKTVAMVDLDHLAVPAVPARHGNGAGCRRAGRLAIVGAKFEARVHRVRAQERVRAHAEAGIPFQFGWHRL